MKFEECDVEPPAAGRPMKLPNDVIVGRNQIQELAEMKASSRCHSLAPAAVLRLDKNNRGRFTGVACSARRSTVRGRLHHTKFQPHSRRTLMPQYFFTVRRSEVEMKYPNGVMLPNNAAAISYAEHIIVTLGASSDLSIIVENGAREPVLFIPGLPACA
jgi:hypothetical protein